MFHLDHLCLIVRDSGDGVRGVHEETGLAYYDGGVLAGSIANTIFPLGGDVYLEVEAAMGPAAEPDSAAGYFDGLLADGADRWLFWSLRADTLEEMTAVAQRLGDEVARLPGRVGGGGPTWVHVEPSGGDQCSSKTYIQSQVMPIRSDLGLA